MPLLFVIIYGILALTILTAGVYNSRNLIRGVDLRFNEENAKAKGGQLNLSKARQEQAYMGWLGWPMGWLAISGMTYHWIWSFTLLTYVFCAGAWFVSAPLRRLWIVAAAIKLDAAMVQYGGREQSLFASKSAWRNTLNYYRRGLKRHPAKKGGKIFVDRLAVLNHLRVLFRVLRLNVLWAILLEAAASLLWPLMSTGISCGADGIIKDLSPTPWWNKPTSAA